MLFQVIFSLMLSLLHLYVSAFCTKNSAKKHKTWDDAFIIVGHSTNSLHAVTLVGTNGKVGTLRSKHHLNITSYGVTSCNIHADIHGDVMWGYDMGI